MTVSILEIVISCESSPSSNMFFRCLLTAGIQTPNSCAIAFGVHHIVSSFMTTCIESAHISPAREPLLAFDTGYRRKLRDNFHEVGLVGHDLRDVLVGAGGLLQVLLSANGMDDALRFEFCNLVRQG